MPRAEIANAHSSSLPKIPATSLFLRTNDQIDFSLIMNKVTLSKFTTDQVTI